MTDKEARDIGAMVFRTTASGQDVIGPIVKAGYRAAIEEAHDTFVSIRRAQSGAEACEVYGRWLDAKLKEKP